MRLIILGLMTQMVLAATVCRQCSAGTQSTGLGATTCSACAAGSYSTASGATTCTTCVAGSYTTASGATVCSGCNAGSYLIGSASTSCAACTDGTYSMQGASSCVPEDTVIQYTISLPMTQVNFQTRKQQFISSIAQAVNLPNNRVNVTSVYEITARRLLSASVTVGTTITTINKLQDSVENTLSNISFVNIYLAMNNLPAAISGSVSLASPAKTAEISINSPAPGTISNSSHSSTSSSNTAIIGAAVGAAVGGLTIILFAAVFWLKIIKLPRSTGCPEEPNASKDEAMDQGEVAELGFLLDEHELADQKGALLGPMQAYGIKGVKDLKHLEETEVEKVFKDISPLTRKKLIKLLSFVKAQTLLTDEEKETIKTTARATYLTEKKFTKLFEQTYELRTGRPVEASKGLNARMCVSDQEIAVSISQGLQAMENEVNTFAATFETAEAYEVKELLNYIIHQKSSQKVYPNGIRDKGREGKTLEDFFKHEKAQKAGLTKEEVAAIRFYTTAAFKFMNDPLRDDERHKQEKRCPLAVITHFAQSGIKKLRDPEKIDTKEGATLWRGMRDLKVAENFMTEGGTELGFMSTTRDLEVAVKYSSSMHSLLFKIVPQSFMQYGADVQWLSAFPDEAEILYPPLTYLQPTGKTEQFIVRIGGVKVTFAVVEVQPHLA